MRSDMGTFRVDVEVENPARPGERRTVKSVLVDSGAELSWIPAEVLDSLGVERRRRWQFRQADGSILERWTSVVEIHVAGKGAGDEVVFGEPGDLVLLGSRSLEGLNFRVDPLRKRLVDAGPAPAAAAAYFPRSPGRNGSTMDTAISTMMIHSSVSMRRAAARSTILL
jgi:predicted aspartyl protease